MKILVVIVILLAAIAGYVYLYPGDVRTILQGTPVEPLVRGTPLAPPQETTLYQWRDASGQWQVSDKPPVGEIQYQTLHYRSDVNVMPALKEEKK